MSTPPNHLCSTSLLLIGVRELRRSLTNTNQFDTKLYERLCDAYVGLGNEGLAILQDLGELCDKPTTLHQKLEVDVMLRRLVELNQQWNKVVSDLD